MTPTTTQTFAVWYASAGCLPDSDHPEYVGTFDECLAWARENVADYLRPDTVHDAYGLVIDEYDGEEVDA